jgi:hypothetical protein
MSRSVRIEFARQRPRCSGNVRERVSPAIARVTDAADSLQCIFFRPGERKKYITAQLTIGGTRRAFLSK